MIFDVDWQGADALHDEMPNDVVSVFVLPPSIAALRERLGFARRHDGGGVERRMRDARAEIRHWRRYDYCIVNDDLRRRLRNLGGSCWWNARKRLRQRDLDAHVRELLDEGSAGGT